MPDEEVVRGNCRLKSMDGYDRYRAYSLQLFLYGNLGKKLGKR